MHHFTYNCQMESLCEKILKDFQSDTKKYKNIKILISAKNCEKYLVVTINCASLDKIWFFHTTTCFSEEDYKKFTCLLKELQYCFEYLCQ